MQKRGLPVRGARKAVLTLPTLEQQKLKGRDEFQHFGNRTAEIDVRGYFAHLRPGQLTGEDEGNAGDQEIYLGKEFFQVKVTGHAGQMSIDKIRVLLPANEFDIPERDIGPEIDGPDAVEL